ncbi:hypothetical protein AB0I77_44195 [Streptomyces sp. NPDC050619]|uniref:phthiocerol/phthiodiolone dimycocerosyl transferase family protein n=1 Tax=Streptomyces sp. NPDC050619 TaxID=3157214 RepID=UPI00341B8B5D
MSTRRYLSPDEAMMAASDTWLIFSSCTLRGDLDPACLAKALAVAVAAHPALSARTDQDDNGPFLTPSEPPELRVVPAAAPGSVEQEMNAPLKPGGPLVRAALFLGDDEHVFTLLLNHAISDATCIVAIQQDLWRTYTALVAGPADDVATPTGAEPAHARPSFPVSRDSRMPHIPEAEIESYVDRLTARIAALPAPLERPPTPPVLATGSCEVQRIILSPEETTGLLAAARTEGISLQAVVAASLLTAARIQSARLTGNNAPATMTCYYPVDLRSRLDPPVPQEEFFCCVGAWMDLFDVPAPTGDGPPLDLAHAVASGLAGAFERNEMLLHTASLSRLLAHPMLLDLDVILSNLGVIARPVTPAGLDMTEFRFMSVARPGESGLVVAAHTMDGRLTLDFSYDTHMFSTARMHATLASARAALGSFLGLSDSGGPTPVAA